MKNKALLDACTLDVAVIGSESAARVYARTPDPVAVGDANGKRRTTTTTKMKVNAK